MSLRVAQKRGTGSHLISIIFGSFIVVFVAILSAYILNNNINRTKSQEAIKSEELSQDEPKRLKYWGVVLWSWNEAGNLRSMDRVFERLQFEFVHASNNGDWDILWSIESPYHDEDHELLAGFKAENLRREQKVNHFTGMSALVSKSDMNKINQGLPYILPSFVLPGDTDRLKKFQLENPQAKFVHKKFYNRGVKIVDAKDIIYDYSNVFYQQFLDKPFLVNGHAFDFGVFVLITSVDPLRIYRYDADVLFRFCEKKYHPFDPEDTDRYVVKDGCHPPYYMHLFEETYETYKYPFRMIFENYIRKKGFDVDEMWRKVDDAIVRITMNAAKDIVRSVRGQNLSSHHMFELVRFDFVFDENLEPFVMEVNMSPNITPAKPKYEENAIIYEQMIMEVVKMVGFGSVADFSARFNDSDIAVANRKNIAVDIEKCLKYECDKNCAKQRCQTCLPCLSDENRFQLREAFREHSYEANFRRVFPKAHHFVDEEFYQNMTRRNRISTAWFHAKCREDERWC